MNIDKKFQIDRQGKTFVLYAGLLDAAHAAGLDRIDTYLIQAPSKENGETTIVKAEAHFADGEKGIRVFSGIGDANPTNVGRNIAPHAIRMAETRAKARALRDALNIGAAALEELGGDDEEPPPVRAVPRRTQEFVVQPPALPGDLHRGPPAPVLPMPKGAYSADELRAYRDAGQAPPNLESAAVKFAEEVYSHTKKALPVPQDKGLELLVWLIDMTAKWEASPKNPRNAAAVPV